MRLKTGFDCLARSQFAPLKGLRVGAICNPTSLDSQLVHLADRLHHQPGVKLEVLLGPEHGIRGDAQDMMGVEGGLDKRTGVKIWSLYGKTFDSLAPPEEALQELDALIFDIQDVGSRYYTYIYTMALCMQAAARANIKFFVLDRPNPINGIQMEGNLIEKGYESFVGMYSLPNRHGMTVGEIARMWNEQYAWKAELTVVPIEGWHRSNWMDQTGMPFIPPSPNMPTLDTAMVYPGMCLVEGTNLSEGRGTTRPFETVGAPYLDAYSFGEELRKENLPGVDFRPLVFRPTFHKYAQQSCEGIMLHVRDRKEFLPLRTGIAVLLVARRIGGQAFGWRTEPYEFVDNIPAIDLLCGTNAVRKAIDEGKSLDECLSSFNSDLSSFFSYREKYLLY